MVFGRPNHIVSTRQVYFLEKMQHNNVGVGGDRRYRLYYALDCAVQVDLPMKSAQDGNMR